MKGYALLPDETRQAYGLVLVGGIGWYMEDDLAYIKNLQSKGMNIVVTGYVSDVEKKWLYQNASLFVVPSHYEGFGMTILEAMDYGIPTVVSNIDVFREVADSASLFFDKDSPASIAETMARVLSSPALQSKLVSKGKKKLKDYNWANVATAVYKQLEGLAQPEP